MKKTILLGTLLLLVFSGCISTYTELEDVESLTTCNPGETLTVNPDGNGVICSSTTNTNQAIGDYNDTIVVNISAGVSATIPFNSCGANVICEYGTIPGGRNSKDTTGYTQHRLNVSQTNGGNINTFAWAQWSDDNVTFYDLNIMPTAFNLKDLGVKISQWYDVNSQGIGENKIYRFVGISDNTSGISFRQVHIEMKKTTQIGIRDINLSLIDLNDTPNTYSGQANKILSIKSTEDGIEFITNNGGTDTNCSTSPDCNNLYIQSNPLSDQNINIKDLNLNGGALNLRPNNNANTGIELINQDGSIDFKVDANGNIRIDGNILFQDVNSNIGNAGIPVGQIFAYNFRGVPTNNGANLIIPGQTYAFCVFGTNCSGLFFSSTTPRGFKFRIDGNERWIFGAGATGVDGALWQILRTADPSGTGTQIEGWTFLKDIGLIDYNAQPYTYRQGVYQHLNSRMYLGTPNDLITDGNWTGDINAHGDYHFDGNVIIDKNIYGQLITPGNIVGTSCNTTCGAISYAGPWTCVEADNITGAASTCTDTTVAHNCVCRN